MVHNGGDITIKLTREAVLQGWRDIESGLWRVPLKQEITNDKTDTVLLNMPSPIKSISNVYDLPSVETQIRYLHAAAGYPTKEMWLKAIRKGNYVS